ncbi:metal-dependent hydrolase, partial [Bacillus halotolerans]
MANFHTHITVAAVASVSVAIILAGSGIVEPGFAVLLCALGTLGGILPDIDSDHSTSIKIIFHCFSIGLAFLVTFALLSHYSILICLVVWFGVYLAVLFIVQPIFKNFTVHR